MNLRWLWLDHFPPGMELTEAQRLEAKKRAREHRLVDQNYRGTGKAMWRTAAFISGLLSLLFCLWLYGLLAYRLRTHWHVVALVTGILMFQALIWMGIALAVYRTYAPYIRNALCDMNLPVCVDCGYILTGIHENAPCPECGAAREAATPHEARSN